MEIYGIVGAGGFGREVMPIVEEMLSVISGNTDLRVYFVVENAPSGEFVNGIQVISEQEFLTDSCNDPLKSCSGHNSERK